MEDRGPSAVPQRVLQSAKRERHRMHRQHPQAHYGPGEEVHDGGEVQPAAPVAEVGEVGSPGRILTLRERGHKQVRVRGLRPVIPLLPGALRPAAVGFDAEEAHHPTDALPVYPKADG